MALKGDEEQSLSASFIMNMIGIFTQKELKCSTSEAWVLPAYIKIIEDAAKRILCFGTTFIRYFFSKT